MLKLYNSLNTNTNTNSINNISSDDDHHDCFKIFI